MSDEKSSKPGSFILTQDGKRIDGLQPFGTREDAEKAVPQQQQIQESKGRKGRVEIKENLFG